MSSADVRVDAPVLAVPRFGGLRIPLPVTLVLIPAAFIIVGLVIRYFAYTAAVPTHRSPASRWACADGIAAGTSTWPNMATIRSRRPA